MLTPVGGVLRRLLEIEMEDLPLELDGDDPTPNIGDGSQSHLGQVWHKSASRVRYITSSQRHPGRTDLPRIHPKGRCSLRS